MCRGGRAIRKDSPRAKPFCPIFQMSLHCGLYIFSTSTSNLSSVHGRRLTFVDGGRAVTEEREIATFDRLLRVGVGGIGTSIHFCQTLRIIPNCFAAPDTEGARAVEEAAG